MTETKRADPGSAPLVSAAVVCAAGLLVLPLSDLGPLSLQMTHHLVLMNVAAPLVALLVAARMPALGVRALWFAAVSQLLLLWAWHLPGVQQAAAASGLLQATMLLFLGAAALAFWLAIIAAERAGGWRAIAGLLLTGKFACLLGALLIFAPRDLYGLPGLALAFCSSGPSSLEDQQLAGLLMVTACPLSYLTAGVVVAARLLSRIANEPDRHAAGAR
ncbi:cytochrome c oxidase assembly protein [Bosea sp. LjRoot237]|uniref:cytochrome c oxidase assembly protein n=1 Tax=Bosea sp. LjRoot237 TaxID=3342292 RepID=UPI003ECED6B3